MSKKQSKWDEKISEYRSMSMAEHDPDIIWDDDGAYEDYIKNWKPVEELMKEFPPEQPIDIHEWTKDDFRSYFEVYSDAMGEDAAWALLYSKILHRAGEGDGSIALEELTGDNV